MNNKDISLIRTALRLCLKLLCILVYNQLFRYEEWIPEETLKAQRAVQREASYFADELQ